MSLIQIEVAMLKAVALASAVKDIRTYLNGVAVNVTRGGDVILVATDGHRMHVGRLTAATEAQECTVIIPSDTIKRALAGNPKGSATIELYRDQGDDWQLGLVPFKHEGVYPDWRRVIPREFSDLRMPPINGKYLGDVGEAAALLGDKLRTLQVNNAGSSGLLIRIAARPSFFAVMMPQRPTETIRKDPGHPWHEMEAVKVPAWV
ncbi:hypothetical protein [Bordetella genomosp. 1]|uniref:Beta sliding clamp n=1 Tax=Bordetella genomosp. 1 TaxID=1395607 RepID=A0ABX4EW82_9BORD|nr:hypothetical protein [Bordetella genomosp. 1]OZI58734.1 hypothetical protein CAL27_18810 [Bordetella genomosp. 1]